MAPFRAVPPRPFTNIKVRVRDDRLQIFSDLGDGFDGWRGVFGQYARGWSDPPPGAIWLTDVGPEAETGRLDLAISNSQWMRGICFHAQRGQHDPLPGSRP
ncbi:hypothetical protein [Sinorhizobium fredii]|nr:hypothetical protein [Sinorhizobium fredii]